MNPGSKILAFLFVMLAGCASAPKEQVTLYDGAKNPRPVATAPKAVIDSRAPGTLAALDKPVDWAPDTELGLNVLFRLALFIFNTEDNQPK